MITPTPNISINDGNLVVHGKTILTAVPDNILLSSSDADADAGLVTTGAFIGATADRTKSIHIFQVGALEGLRFMCLFRFKLWWMTQRMGTNGNDIPLETQFMLVESKDDYDQLSPPAAASAAPSTIYTVFLPLLQGQFRAVLQGNQNNQMEICLESGDHSVQTRHAPFLVYIHGGTDPFQVIYQAVIAVQKHLQTFRHRHQKKLPSFLDWFGWCTWDAFYTDVTAEGVEQGLKSLSGGGFPPRFLIIDDGWQQVDNEGNDDSNVIVQGGAHFTDRLMDIKENEKFQKPSLKVVVEKAKKNHNVKYVYLWHALAGYWSGVKPAAVGMEQFEPTIAYPIQSPGVLGNQPDVVMDILAVNGLGIIHPKKVFSFYNELHGYLASCGVNGVKVDVQSIIETLGAGHGGRVSLTRDYLEALEASIEKNFADNGCIACMSHNTDGIYSSKQTAVVRASDDFYPRDPASHTMHVASVAYNSVFLGEFMQPDWDMFHSLHPAAEYHAAARAVGGCPIYVSDKPGNHNFDLLKKLVLPDGSVLRGQLPGRPTLDCLFVDPTRDGKSLLKIWNANKCSGVVGVFNCQGAGWCKIAKKILIHNTSPEELTGYVKAEDVAVLSQIAGANWNGDSVVFAHKSGEIIRLQKGESLPVTLKVLEHEVFHFCPLKDISKGVFFAPVGLLDMFNSGGAVEEFDDHANPVSVSINQQETWTKTVALTVKGSGRLGAYSSRPPHKCSVDGIETGFEYDAARGLLTLSIPIPMEEMYKWKVEIEIEV